MIRRLACDADIIPVALGTRGHHIVHWVNGGITALPTLVLLCGAHHRLIHHTPWEVRLNPTTDNPSSDRHPNPAGHTTGSGSDHDASERGVTPAT